MLASSEEVPTGRSSVAIALAIGIACFAFLLAGGTATAQAASATSSAGSLARPSHLPSICTQWNRGDCVIAFGAPSWEDRCSSRVLEARGSRAVGKYDCSPRTCRAAGKALGAALAAHKAAGGLRVVGALPASAAATVTETLREAFDASAAAYAAMANIAIDCDRSSTAMLELGWKIRDRSRAVYVRLSGSLFFRTAPKTVIGKVSHMIGSRIGLDTEFSIAGWKVSMKVSGNGNTRASIGRA